MAKVKINDGKVFERQEKKFKVPPNIFSPLMRELEPYMEQDEYGLQQISSVYYDTDNFDLIRISLDKPKYKEKLRMRSYGTPGKTDTVYLELKKKLNRVTYKRRMSLPLDHALSYMKNGVKFPETKGQIFEEIDWFVNHWHTSPKVFISYNRIALFGKEDSNLRITFDRDIRWRDYDLDPSQGDYGNRLIPIDYRIMEIKTLGSLPLWLCSILSKLEIYPQSFSKYGNVYSQYLVNNYKEEIKNVG